MKSYDFFIFFRFKSLKGQTAVEVRTDTREGFTDEFSADWEFIWSVVLMSSVHLASPYSRSVTNLARLFSIQLSSLKSKKYSACLILVDVHILRTSFCSTKWHKMDPYRRLYEKKEEICLEFPQRTRKQSLTDWFCPNKQFDGGIFDWVSENFIFLEQKLDLFFFVLEL